MATGRECKEMSGYVGRERRRERLRERGERGREMLVNCEWKYIDRAMTLLFLSPSSNSFPAFFAIQGKERGKKESWIKDSYSLSLSPSLSPSLSSLRHSFNVLVVPLTCTLLSSETIVPRSLSQSLGLFLNHLDTTLPSLSSSLPPFLSLSLSLLIGEKEKRGNGIKKRDVEEKEKDKEKGRKEEGLFFTAVSRDITWTGTMLLGLFCYPAVHYLSSPSSSLSLSLSFSLSLQL